ncbi:arabinose operon transcriptional regulator AraC [Lonepinella sp. MS14436]|uniref:arabinose operon transcriptional regulator AraC n=1 Tax=Lonepinella sp. MS14436 TaxID=3003619 RepID=UPI0036DE63C1
MQDNKIRKQPFNSALLADITQSERGNYQDFLIDRPEGMTGFMLQLTTFGKGMVFDGERIFEVERGQLLLFSPQAVQHYQRQPESQFWHYKWIYFSPKPQWLKWLQWRDSSAGIYQLKLQDNQHLQEISQLFSKIADELNENQAISQELTESLLEYLLIKCFSAEQTKVNNSLDQRIVQVCSFINEQLAEPLEIDTLAQQVYLSSSRLSHLFKQQMGVSLVQYKEMQRITEAKKLLYFSNMSVSTIAKSIGYDDALYFSKVFKKHTALSPIQFRHLERNKNL